MPTYNRYPWLGFLPEEALQCFLLQDYPDRELIICNDTPGQILTCADPRVRILNLDERLPNLSAKIQHLIDHAQGELLCRWDDDDIHLPHRLSYSAAKLGGRLEWRAANHWYDHDGRQPLHETLRPGNSHVHALWRRDVLAFMGGAYPVGFSGCEDQAFNRALLAAGPGVDSGGETIPRADIYYLYRFNTGGPHLSGKGNPTNPTNPHQSHYEEIGTRPIVPGEVELRPRWRRDYVAWAREAAGR